MPGAVARIAAPAGALIFSIGLFAGGFNYAAGDAALCLLASLFLAALMLAAPPAPCFWRRAAPALLLAVAALGWAALPLVANGRFAVLAPDILPGNLLGLVGLLAALMAGMRIGHGGADLAGVTAWLVGLACLVALAGLTIQVDDAGLVFETWRPGASGRFMATLDNANVAGCFFGANAVLAFSIVLRAWRDRARRVLRQEGDAVRLPLRMAAGLIAMILLLGACLLTASRTAFLLSIGAAAILALLPVRRAALLPILAGGAVLAVVALTSSGMLLERFETLRGDGLARIDLWSHAWGTAAGAPIQGYGLGSYPLAAARALDEAFAATTLWTANSAHNKPIQLIIEGGWPYAALVIAAFIAIAFTIARGLYRQRYPSAALALAMAALVVIGCGMVDIALDVPALTAWMLFAAGLAWGRLARVPESAVDAPKLMPPQKQRSVGVGAARSGEERGA